MSSKIIPILSRWQKWFLTIRPWSPHSRIGTPKFSPLFSNIGLIKLFNNNLVWPHLGSKRGQFLVTLRRSIFPSACSLFLGRSYIKQMFNILMISVVVLASSATLLQQSLSLPLIVYHFIEGVSHRGWEMVGGECFSTVNFSRREIHIY